MIPTPVEPTVIAEVRGRVGCLTLNRPKALNALSLGLVRDLTAALLTWRDEAQVLAVVIRGMGKEGPFGAFCAGGDIRFFHQAALAGNPELEDFFILRSGRCPDGQWALAEFVGKPGSDTL